MRRVRGLLPLPAAAAFVAAAALPGSAGAAVPSVLPGDADCAVSTSVMSDPTLRTAVVAVRAHLVGAVGIAAECSVTWHATGRTDVCTAAAPGPAAAAACYRVPPGTGSTRCLRVVEVRLDGVTHRDLGCVTVQDPGVPT